MYTKPLPWYKKLAIVRHIVIFFTPKTSVGKFKSFQMPMIKQKFAPLDINELVSVLPMTAPVNREIKINYVKLSKLTKIIRWIYLY